MDNDILNEKQEKDTAGMVKFAGVGIYIASVVFFEVMFLVIMGSVFPNAIIGTIAKFGAVMTGACAIWLLFAKDYYFEPGRMHKIGVTLMWVEWIILALNGLLAFEVAMNTIQEGYWSWWANFSPASPISAVLTVGLLALNSSEHANRQRKKEVLAAVDANFLSEWQRAFTQPEIKEIISRGAYHAAQRKVDEMSGQFLPYLPASKPDIMQPNGNGSATREYHSEVESLEKNVGKRGES